MLNAPVNTLESSRYFDPAEYQRELTNLFSTEWLCIGRESDWGGPGSYRRMEVAGQRIFVVRSGDARLRGFFDTCRHRGSVLCESPEGRFRAGRIVCPYHAWAYDLEGRLLKTTPLPEDFRLDHENLSLYPVNVEHWRGFVFVNLARKPERSFKESLGEGAGALRHWPLEELALARRETHRVACNWKVFWENFLECLHCPGVHPDLCRLVPLYGEGVVAREDLPDGNSLREAGHLRDGALTWSSDGQPVAPCFPGLSDEERQAGMTFVTSLPSVFIVGHVDYVRSVRVAPAGPEATDLTVDWLVSPDALATGDVDVESLAEFGRRVVLEDARVCELNQQGLRNRVHRGGVLMPQEYDIAAFHAWINERVRSATPAPSASAGASPKKNTDAPRYPKTRR
jgi:Rieske 2Fe-2S family protein